MENLDVIILSGLVVIAFVVFIITSLKEIVGKKDDPYEYEKPTGFTRTALFDALSSLFDEDEISEKRREKFKTNLQRTISDMETDGMYFDKSKEMPKENKPEDKGGS